MFGRNRVRRHVDEAGKVVTSHHEIPLGDWEICIPQHHPGYVDWDTYLANRATLRANWRSPAGQAAGSVREGPALLQGLVRCGRCGRKMIIGYSGVGSQCRYLCAQGLRLYGTTRTCQSIGGRRIDARVVEEVFALLEPASLAATTAALSEAERHHQQQLRVFELAVERARYEAERARRQFDAVEPENRLVARNLERDWEQRLVAVRHAEADLARQKTKRPATLTTAEIAWLSRAGADLHAVFDAPTTTQRERKQLLRALISEVIVTVEHEAGQAKTRIVWEGGATTEFTVALARRGHDSARRTEQETIDIVRRLAPHYSDATMARLLARQGRPTATGLPFTAQRVGALRLKWGIPGHQVHQRQNKSTGEPGAVELVSVAEAEQILGVSKATLYRWLSEGIIVGEQQTPGAPWLIKIDAVLRARIVGDSPAGWVGLDQAAKALGVARQTVLDRIRRSELNAVHVTRGRRKGLAIELPPAQPQLFARH